MSTREPSARRPHNKALKATVDRRRLPVAFLLPHTAPPAPLTEDGLEHGHAGPLVREFSEGSSLTGSRRARNRKMAENDAGNRCLAPAALDGARGSRRRSFAL